MICNFLNDHLCYENNERGRPIGRDMCDLMLSLYEDAITASGVITRLFPTPFAVDATLRFLADKVASVFISTIPYAVAFWTLVSLVKLSMFFIKAYEDLHHRFNREWRKYLPNEAIRAVATVANTVLYFGGTNTTLLADTCTTFGQLTSWQSVLVDVRRVSFLSSFFIAMNNFSHDPVIIGRQVLNIGVVLLEPYCGYTTLIGAMATVSCLLASSLLFSSPRPDARIEFEYS
jgi:hypothetical protein